MSVLGLDEEEEKDSECSDEPDSEVDPGEGDELLFHLREVSANEGEVVILARLLCVQALGVAVELGERLALVLAGALQDSDCALGFGELAFGFHDALHCESDVGVHILRVLCDPPVEVVGKAAGLAEFVLEARDAVVEAVDVGSDLVVVVDDCLDGGVAVVAACSAVALGLGVGVGHGVSFWWGWVVRLSLLQIVDKIAELFRPLLFRLGLLVFLEVFMRFETVGRGDDSRGNTDNGAGEAED